MNEPPTKSFGGLRVAIFEARMAGALAELVTRQGGVPVSAPALREVPLEDNPVLTAFAESLATGGFDLVIFETGVGVRYLVQSLGDSL
jgi:uroporphyrinogen-III synthase